MVHQRQQQQQPKPKPPSRSYSTNSTSNSSRIPLALQNVFVRGSRGQDVHTPPPDASAMKTYYNNNSNNNNTKRNNWSISSLLRRSKSNDIYDVAVMTTSGSAASQPSSTDFTDIPKIQRKSQRKLSMSKAAALPTLSPQEYLDGMLLSRGYSNERYSSLSTAYYNKPSPLQLASYGVYVINMIHSNDIDGMKAVLDLGLSPNACNTFGESIVHTVCRISSVGMMDVLLQYGCTVQVADDYGRTPLHDACWAPVPNFPLIEKILHADRNLLYMSDNRGHLPLSYIRKDHWSEWLQFLQSKKDDFWPKFGTASSNNIGELETCAKNRLPNTQPFRAPKIPFLPISRAQMIAQGKLSQNVARQLQDLQKLKMKNNSRHFIGHYADDADTSSNDDDASLFSVDSATSSSNDDKASCHNDFNDSIVSSSWNVDEMNEILNHLSQPKRVPLAW